MTAFVADTIDKVIANPETNRDKENLLHLKDRLTEQICALTGGGCTYRGDALREAHTGHHVNHEEFFGLVEALRESMRARDVPLKARNELLEILAPMKRDVTST